MKRKEFLVLSAGFACGFAPAQSDSTSAFFAALPAARPGLWVRYVMGFGVQYQKQIGFGVERTPLATRYFIETQVGMPGGSCNPNSLKKAYLKTRSFGNLVEVYGVDAYVSRSANLVMLEDRQAPPLRLLDSPHLYPKAPAAAHLQSSSAAVPEHPSHHSDDAIVVAKAPVTCTQCTARFDEPLLKEFAVWSAPGVPLGVARIQARVTGMPDFQMMLDSYGFDYRSGIAESLDSVRAEQPQ